MPTATVPEVTAPCVRLWEGRSLELISVRTRLVFPLTLITGMLLRVSRLKLVLSSVSKELSNRYLATCPVVRKFLLLRIR